MCMTHVDIIDDFYYILSRVFDRLEYYQVAVIYNRMKASTTCKISDQKIRDIANLLRQKENVVNE